MCLCVHVRRHTCTREVKFGRHLSLAKRILLDTQRPCTGCYDVMLCKRQEPASKVAKGILHKQCWQVGIEGGTTEPGRLKEEQASSTNRNWI